MLVQVGGGGDGRGESIVELQFVDDGWSRKIEYIWFYIQAPHAHHDLQSKQNMIVS